MAIVTTSPSQDEMGFYTALLSRVPACMRSGSTVAMAGSGRSALTHISTIYEKKEAEKQELLTKMFQMSRPVSMMLRQSHYSDFTFFFFCEQLVGSVSNESLEQLGETNFSFVALFLTWKLWKGFQLCPTSQL